MQTKSSIKHSIKLFVADKPKLARTFEKFETPQDEDVFIYAAFSGSVHELPTRARKSRV